MDMQNVSNLVVPEGEVKAIHDSNNRLLWGRVHYGVHLDGDAEQATYTGKNLFNVNVTPSSYTNTTTSVSGNKITVTSTSSAQTARVDLPFVFEANRQMTISFDAKFIQNDAGDGLISQVCLRTPGTSDTTGATYLTKTIGQTNHYSTVVSAAQSNNNTRQLWLYVKATASAGAVKVEFSNIQIEYGGSETSYEPYTGGIPAPNPDFPEPISVVTGGQTVSVTGKNLASLETSATKTLGGLSFTTDNGVLNINGTTTSNGNFNFDSFRASGNATFWIDVTGYTDATSNSAILLRSSSDNGSTWNTVEILRFTSFATHQASVTLDPSKLYRIRWYCVTGNVFTNAKIKVQLEYGSAKTSYESYQGQNFDVNLGKNLIPYPASSGSTTVQGVIFTQASDGKVTASGTTTGGMNWWFTNSFYPEKTDTYTMSFTGTLQNAVFYCYDLTSSTLAINATTGSGSGTLLKGHRYQIYFNQTLAGKAVSIDGYAQLELGSTASSYAPYFTPIELASIGSYTDYIFNDNGTWKVHKAIGKEVYTGTENITKQLTSIGGYRMPTSANVKPNGYSVALVMCDYATAVPYGTYYNGNTRNYGMISAHDSTTTQTVYMSAIDANTDSVETIKAWLQSHNTTVYYALATPTDTAITDTTLIAQLDAIYDWIRRYGYNAIATTPGGNLPIVIDRTPL